MGKNLDPNIKPEKQHANSKQGGVEKPHTGQGRAGLRRKRPDPINQTIKQPSDLSQKIPRRTKIETRKKKPNTFQRSDAFYKQCEWKDHRQ